MALAAVEAAAGDDDAARDAAARAHELYAARSTRWGWCGPRS